MLKGAQICRALRIPLSDAQGSSDLQSPHQNPSPESFTRTLQNPILRCSKEICRDLTILRCSKEICRALRIPLSDAQRTKVKGAQICRALRTPLSDAQRTKVKGAQICRALGTPLSDAQGSSDLQSPQNR